MSFIEKIKYYKTLFFGALIVLFLLAVYVSTLGVANISFGESLKIIIERVPLLDRYFFDESIPDTYRTIIWQIRLPRIFLAGLVGMSLSVVGATFQGMFKNPMADPYVVGVSSGAALGATIAIVIGVERTVLGLGLINLLAFCGAGGTVLMVYNIARVGNKVPIVTLLLAGIAVSAMLSSVISVMMIFNRDKIESIVFWVMGSVAAASWQHVFTLLPVALIGTAIIFFYAKDLNLIMVGDDSAKSLGVDIEKTKKVLLVLSSIIIAFAVSVSGIIGFVGLIIPHGIRMLVGPDHRVLIPFSALGGAIFLILSDTIARIAIPPTEIPVGAVTAIFGSPYFIYLLYRTKKKVMY
ncbi:iron chelate uptake ABC transporter family permease subunit [Proteinivorax hydrogeniformans]|uniref:Iron chelate uptake ABC transporter family permease subunit n=1 Tax=Proteinivorax hydrogeniformans TaxID=1826727 RepID=A0AAU8HVD1_9FIRM